jgi:hypothetical protein
MALKFKKGQRVRQVMPAPMEGAVAKALVVDDEVQFLVIEGDQARWFKEGEIELVEEKAVAEEPTL